MIDSVQNGNRLVLLEADMKFVPMSLTPAETQLLETRKFSNEEVCRWFGVPPVLVGIPGATTWGSGIAEIVEGFVKFTVGPMLTNIEQSIAKCLLTDAQRSRYQVEFSKDALMRMTPEERFKTWSTAVQNGLMTRNEVRELENRDPIEGGDELTAQTNLAPLQMLGKVASQESPKEKIDDIKQ
jgi:HK97 family phage portal protein